MRCSSSRTGKSGSSIGSLCRLDIVTEVVVSGFEARAAGTQRPARTDVREDREHHPSVPESREAYVAMLEGGRGECENFIAHLPRGLSKRLYNTPVSA